VADRFDHRHIRCRRYPYLHRRSYGTISYTFNLSIPFSESAGTVSNTINVVAAAN
jgi:hypothetical protein